MEKDKEFFRFDAVIEEDGNTEKQEPKEDTSLIHEEGVLHFG